MIAILLVLIILSGLLAVREILRGWETGRDLARAFPWGAIMGAAGGEGCQNSGSPPERRIYTIPCPCCSPSSTCSCVGSSGSPDGLTTWTRTSRSRSCVTSSMCCVARWGGRGTVDPRPRSTTSRGRPTHLRRSLQHPHGLTVGWISGRQRPPRASWTIEPPTFSSADTTCWAD
jgi:hypothetical protein